MLIILLFFVAHWYLSLFFQTFFLHRYAAHQVFTMSPRMEKVFFVLTWVFQGSNYLSAYGYGIMHRMHHAFADTPEDPHSPKYDESLFKMMWKTKTIYSQITNKTMVVDERFTKRSTRMANLRQICQVVGFQTELGSLVYVVLLDFCNYVVAMAFATNPIPAITYSWCNHQLVRT